MEENKDMYNEQEGYEANTDKMTDTASENNNERNSDIVTETPIQKNPWGETVVTRKFMAIALALTILLNAGLTVGVLTLSANRHGAGGPDMRGNGRHGSEMFSDQRPNEGRNRHMLPPQGDQNGNGQMTPPQNGQNGNGQMTPPQNDQNGNSQMTPPQDGQNSNNQTAPSADSSNNNQNPSASGSTTNS